MNARLTELMLACKSEPLYRLVHVMVLGCGDAFISRYWPALEPLVGRHRIKLCVADRGPLAELIRGKVEATRTAGRGSDANQLEARYTGFQRLVDQLPQDIRYLNIDKDSPDSALYAFLQQDIVFVLVPDNAHVEAARPWLTRAALVIIEKPYERDITRAESFEKELDAMVGTDSDRPHTVVYCIDHYLAKIHDSISHWAAAAKSGGRDTRDFGIDELPVVGILKEIEFSICEQQPIEEWRARSLEAGMIYDLFCHVLAQASPFIELRSLIDTRIEDSAVVRVAQHKNCPENFNAETYASFRYERVRDRRGRELLFHGKLGKGLMDQKFLKLIGTEGSFEADFSTPHVKLVRGGGSAPINVDSIGKGHPEMLDAIFHGTFAEKQVGVLRGQTAIETLRIINHLRNRVDSVRTPLKAERHQYAVGASALEIDKTAIRII